MNIAGSAGRAMATALALLALACSPGRAASPEDEYLAARDRYVAQFDPGDKQVDYEKIEAAHKQALGDRATKLRATLGRIALQGSGEMNLMSLVKGDMDFGKLDGLLYKTNGGRTEIVVSTKGLVGKYLVAHKDWWDKDTPNVPQTMAGALAADGFYTQALVGDAAIGKFADIPVSAPAGAGIAVAMLDLRSQDVGVGKPDEIIAALVRGDRVYLVSTKAEAKLSTFAACDTLWKSYERKARKAKDSMKIESEGERAYRRCYAEKLKPTPAFQALTAQAQKLIDALPSR